MRLALFFLFVFAACDSETPDTTQAPASPADPAAQTFTSGRALQARGLFSQAEQAYRQALQQAPDNPQYHYYLGVVLHAQSRFAEAQTQFEKALELKPNYAGPRIALGKMFYDVHGKVEEARQLLTEALELAPQRCRSAVYPRRDPPARRPATRGPRNFRRHRRCRLHPPPSSTTARSSGPKARQLPRGRKTIAPSRTPQSSRAGRVPRNRAGSVAPGPRRGGAARPRARARLRRTKRPAQTPSRCAAPAP